MEKKAGKIIKKEKVIEIFKFYFPNFKVISCNRIQSSWKSPMWSVQLDNKPEELIIKFLIEKNQIEKRLLERNIYLYIRRNKLDIPVPKPILIDTSSNIIKVPIIVEERLRGYDLYQVIDRVKNKDELMTDLAIVVGQINNIEFGYSGYLNANLKAVALSSWKKLIIQEFNNYIEVIENNLYLPLAEVEIIKTKLEDNYHHLDEVKVKSRLVHNDINSRNIKVTEKNYGIFNISGIFDFELALSGDPVRELSKLEWIFNKYPGWKSYFYQEYQKHIDLDDSYHQRLELYCLLNSLKHLSLQEKLSKLPGWDQFLGEARKKISEYIYS